MPPEQAQAPQAMHHLGSGIWSQIRRTSIAILYVMVPQMNMKSAWCGVYRFTSAPKREISYREQAVAMYSMAQHEVPIGIGQREDCCTQLIAASAVV